MIAAGGLQEWEAVGERRAASGLATRQWPHASQAAGNLVAFEGAIAQASHRQWPYASRPAGEPGGVEGGDRVGFASRQWP
jgi:hypothetical protein